MGTILNLIREKAKPTYKKMTTPGKEDSVDVQKELNDLENLANKLKEQQIKKIDTEYDAKMKALPKSIKVRTTKYRKERFESTDEKQFGKEGLRRTYKDILAEANEDVDERSKKRAEEQKEEMKEHAEEESQKSIADKQKEEERRKKENEKRNKEAKEKMLKEHGDDFMLQVEFLGKQAEHEVEEHQKTKESDYKEEEERIEAQAKVTGYAEGAADVEKYNKELADKAKGVVDNIRKGKAKIEVIKEKAKQTVEIQLAGKLGFLATVLSKVKGASEQAQEKMNG